MNPEKKQRKDSRRERKKRKILCIYDSYLVGVGWGGGHGGVMGGEGYVNISELINMFFFLLFFAIFNSQIYEFSFNSIAL